MKNYLQSVEKLLGVYRWHPKIALRYLPIVEEIRRSGIRNPTVLEIGSGSLGIAPYLKQEVTGVDLSFNPPYFPLLKQVIGDALKIPFAAKSFDFVLLVDMLEHNPKEKRQKIVQEAFRVARHEVIIATPLGVQAAVHDQKLARMYEDTYHKPFQYLSQHLLYGIPKEHEIRKLIEIAGGNRIEMLRVQSNINLAVRTFLMWGWMSRNRIVEVLFRKVFLLFIPILRLCNFRPVYRKIFYCILKP